MNDLFETVLTATRTEERAALLLNLVELLYETNYDTELGRIDDLVSMADSAMEIVDAVESLIFVSARSLCERMGVSIAIEDVRQHTQLVLNVLQTILSEVEHFDDYDSLLAIIDSEEPNEIALGNMIGFILGENPIPYHDILTYVQPKVIRTIKGILNAKAFAGLEEYSVDDAPRTKRVMAFIKAHPITPLTELFDNYGFLKPLPDLIADTHLEPTQGIAVNYAKELGVVVAGIAIASQIAVETALDSIDIITPQLIDDTHHDQLLPAARVASSIITEIFHDAI